MKNGSDTITRYTASTHRLRQDTDYYYLITVPDEATASVQQVSGTFRTKATKVTVHFSTLRIVRLIDDDNLHFTFWVNPGGDARVRRRLDVARHDKAGNRWQEGRVYRIDEQLVVTGDGIGVRLLVEGSLKDVGCFGTELFDEGPHYFENATPFTDECTHYNVAKGEYSLTGPQAGAVILRRLLGATPLPRD